MKTRFTVMMTFENSGDFELWLMRARAAGMLPSKPMTTSNTCPGVEQQYALTVEHDGRALT